jgi:predicted AlkP superfamily phosphohydrolase/phosphomutase
MSATGVLRIAAAAALLVGTGCASRPAGRDQVVVLGLDGMDYEVTRDLMARGRMPNFARLARSGTFAPLETTIPPQSPVAWSTFITGLDPGGHGIFDFVHRDPQTRLPYLSTTRTEPPGRTLKIGKYQFPLSSGRVELLRRGEPFWEVLERHGVAATIVRMPANFPPSARATRELSGMGTPDLLGTYGTFSFYTSSPFAFVDRTISGGRVEIVDVHDGTIHGAIEGPDNPFLRQPEKVTAEFTVYIDPRHPVVKLAVGSEERVLQQGEWSDWVPIEFPLLPLQTLSGMCRFYVKQVRPDFELYVSPVNLDPLSPAMPISEPESFAAELARATGRFYTQGMPEDTKSLDEGVLSRDEFLMQARLAGEEVRRQYRHVLASFDSGLLFYYVGNLDQTSHMMWRPRDPGHPAYDEQKDGRYKDVVENLYVEMDAMVGETLERIDPDTMLIVMSDHGFTSWRRSFNLNSWLRDNKYLAVEGEEPDESRPFDGVDWSTTLAYGLGLNGLYLNLAGREETGIVEAGERDRLLSELAEKLLAERDPQTGAPVVTKMYRTDQVFARSEGLASAPDLIVGYAKGTRCSSESAIGGIAAEVLTDNTGEWSGDHCMAADTVPGILLTNRPLKRPAASLQTLAAAILAEFGIEKFPAAP